LFFADPQGWRDWLEAHHSASAQIVVGYWKTGTGRPSMTWSESVDEALCFGWIDGIRRRIDDETYCIRFTPRKPGSTWSSVNVAKMEALESAGRMTVAGRAAYARRSETRTGTYAYEQGEIAFDDSLLRTHAVAWEFWNRQAPSYRKVAMHWVSSAKRAETRERRMAQLVADCAAEQKIKSQRWA